MLYSPADKLIYSYHCFTGWRFDIMRRNFTLIKNGICIKHVILYKKSLWIYFLPVFLIFFFPGRKNLISDIKRVEPGAQSSTKKKIKHRYLHWQFTSCFQWPYIGTILLFFNLFSDVFQIITWNLFRKTIINQLMHRSHVANCVCSVINHRCSKYVVRTKI